MQHSLIAHYSFDQIKHKKEKEYLSPEANNKTKPLAIKEPKIQKGRKGSALFLNEFTTVVLPEKLGWYERGIKEGIISKEKAEKILSQI